MERTAKELMKSFVNEQTFNSTTDIIRAMKELFSDVLQEIMESELEQQLGEVPVKIPRDRNGEYSPQIIGIFYLPFSLIQQRYEKSSIQQISLKVLIDNFAKLQKTNHHLVMMIL